MIPRLPLIWIIDRKALDGGSPIRTARIQVYVDVEVGVATLITLVERSALLQGIVIDRSPAPLPAPLSS